MRVPPPPRAQTLRGSPIPKYWSSTPLGIYLWLCPLVVLFFAHFLSPTVGFYMNLLSRGVFSFPLKEGSCPIIWAKALPKNARSLLPVDVHQSKMTRPKRAYIAHDFFYLKFIIYSTGFQSLSHFLVEAFLNGKNGLK